MRRFNPEKELYKIQHGNRNKLILFVISLLVVGVIGYSFALYQVRYSKRIIYTKVAPFSTHDLDLAIYVDGKPDNLPSKGTAYYNGITCDNDSSATAEWDYTNWELKSINTTVPNKCNINFTKTKPTLIEQIKYVNATNNNMVVIDETPDRNLRYIGADPNNYIWFNCSDYNNLTQSTAATKCEKWRIISLMNNITKVAGGQENLVKIIRADSIGNIAWDKSNTNNWTTASLQVSLNGDYLTPSSGTYTSSTTVKAINDITQGIIENVVWNLGGQNDIFLSSRFYEIERATRQSSSPPSTWPGYIGLMYPSDYAYATGGSNSGTSRSACLIYDSSRSYSNGCKEKDWLFISGYQYTLTALDGAGDIYYITNVGNIVSTYLGASTGRGVRPSLYLKSTVKISSGTGSSTEPYILIP